MWLYFSADVCERVLLYTTKSEKEKAVLNFSLSFPGRQIDGGRGLKMKWKRKKREEKEKLSYSAKGFR